MGMISEESLAKQADVQILGRTYSLKTEDREKLNRAAQRIHERLSTLSEKQPLLKPQELQILLLLEMSLELEDLREEGKSLLKEADQLIDWIGEKSQ